MKERFDHEGHKKLWDWLSKNPELEKEHYFEDNNIPLIPILLCYACDFVEEIYNHKEEREDINCKECPLEWGNYYENYRCEKKGSPYNIWRFTLDNETRVEYAKIIRDLPLSSKQERRLKDE